MGLFQYLLFLGGTFPILYGIIRIRIYFQNRENLVAWHLPMAMALTGLGIFCFGLFPGGDAPPGPILGAVTAIGQAFGYSHFIAIPAYLLLTRKYYLVAKHALYIFSFSLIAIALAFPHSTVNTSIGHLPIPTAFSFIFLLELALLSNTILLARYFQKLRKLSLRNTVGLIISYTFSMPACYLYLGKNALLLNLTALGLMIGVFLLLISALVQLPGQLTPLQNE